MSIQNAAHIAGVNVVDCHSIQRSTSARARAALGQSDSEAARAAR
jgi:hypothetical protein